MKRIVKIAGVLCFGLVTAIAWAADPAEGNWISVDDKSGEETAVWEFYTLDGVLYGKMTAVMEQPPNPLASRCKESYRGFPFAGKVNEMPIVGTTWIFGLKNEKPGQWKGGNVINPEDGNMYKCSVTFHPADGKKYAVDTLEMRGEIGLGIGRSQFWHRATKEEAEGLGALSKDYVSNGGAGFLYRAFATSGKTIINAVSAGAGFAVLALSRFTILADLGLLIALTMFTSAAREKK